MKGFRAGWTRHRMKFATTINARSLPESTDPDFEFDYVDISRVTQGVIDSEPQAVTFGSAPSRARRLADPGDTVVSTVRTYLRAVAEVSPTDLPQVFSTGFAVIKGRPGILDPRFLTYYLQSSPFVERVVADSVGVSYPAINASDLAAYDFWAPNIIEQTAIADFLDRETAQIDAMIEAQEHLLQTLINRRTATRRRGFFTLRDMADIRPLKLLARKVSGSAFPLEEQGMQGLDLPFYKVAALASRDVHGVIVTESDTITSETRAKLGARMIPTGSSLMAKIGVASLLARVGVISRDCCIDNNMVAFIPHTGVDPRFLYHTLCDIDIYPYINQSTIPYMNERAIMNAPIPLPNLAEQRRLVNKLDGELAKASALVAETESMIFLLRERREALITAAVSGRIDPTTGIERIEEAS